MTLAVLNRAAACATDYVAGVRDRPVRATASGDDLRLALGGALPEHGSDPVEVIDRLAKAAETGTVATGGSRYFGFVVGGSLPVATAADWLVSSWDQNAATFVLSPLTSVVEAVVSGWVKDLVGLDARHSVGFVTGCQMANFTCLAAARHHVLQAARWDVERQGLFGAPAIDVLVSDEAHYTVFTALRMLGLGSDRLRRVPADTQGRMRADALAAFVEGGRGPCIICAQTGNVNTGAFDPIDQIASIATARGAWLHVDGAFGLWAAATPALRPLLAGIEKADSIATDAHKWLNVPYDCGLALTAHPEAHRGALLLPAHYVVATSTERDSRDFTPEESRRARAVPVYAALSTLGRAGLAELVDRCCALARQMAKRLSQHPQVAVLNEVVLNQVLVRCTPPSRDATAVDDFTRRVIASVQEEGTCWLSGTLWQGQAAMRISIVNWSTTEADIDRSADAILAAVAKS